MQWVTSRTGRVFPFYYSQHVPARHRSHLQTRRIYKRNISNEAEPLATSQSPQPLPQPLPSQPLPQPLPSQPSALSSEPSPIQPPTEPPPSTLAQVPPQQPLSSPHRPNPQLSVSPPSQEYPRNTTSQRSPNFPTDFPPNSPQIRKPQNLQHIQKSTDPKKPQTHSYPPIQYSRIPPNPNYIPKAPPPKFHPSPQIHAPTQDENYSSFQFSSTPPQSRFTQPQYTPPQSHAPRQIPSHTPPQTYTHPQPYPIKHPHSHSPRQSPSHQHPQPPPPFPSFGPQPEQYPPPPHFHPHSQLPSNTPRTPRWHETPQTRDRSSYKVQQNGTTFTHSPPHTPRSSIPPTHSSQNATATQFPSNSSPPQNFGPDFPIYSSAFTPAHQPPFSSPRSHPFSSKSHPNPPPPHPNSPPPHLNSPTSHQNLPTNSPVPNLTDFPNLPWEKNHPRTSYPSFAQAQAASEKGSAARAQPEHGRYIPKTTKMLHNAPFQAPFPSPSPPPSSPSPQTPFAHLQPPSPPSPISPFSPSPSLRPSFRPDSSPPPSFRPASPPTPLPAEKTNPKISNFYVQKSFPAHKIILKKVNISSVVTTQLSGAINYVKAQNGGTPDPAPIPPDVTLFDTEDVLIPLGENIKQVAEAMKIPPQSPFPADPESAYKDFKMEANRVAQVGQSFAIIGGPKTGKTRLLASCARRAAAKLPDVKVLFLCLDEEGKKYVCERYEAGVQKPGENLQVHTYSSLCALFAEERVAQRKEIDKQIKAAKKIKEKKELEATKPPEITIINDHDFAEWVLRNCAMPVDSTHPIYRRAKVAAISEYCTDNPAEKQILSMIIKKILTPYAVLDSDERKFIHDFEAKLATTHTYRENGQMLIATLQKSVFQNLKFGAVFVDDFHALREDQVKFLAHLLAEKHQLIIAGDDDAGENLNNFMLYTKAFGLKDLQFYPLLKNYSMHVHLYSHARVVISQTPNRLELFGFPKLIESNSFRTHAFYSVCASKLRETQFAQEERSDAAAHWAHELDDETRKLENEYYLDKGTSRAQHMGVKNEEEEADLVLRVVNMIREAPPNLKPTICIVPHNETSATNTYNHLLGKVDITTLGLGNITAQPIVNLYKAIFTYVRFLTDKTQTAKQFLLFATSLYGFTPEEANHFFKSNTPLTTTASEAEKVEAYQTDKKRIFEAIHRKKNAAPMLQFLLEDPDFQTRLKNSQAAQDYPEEYLKMMKKFETLLTNVKKSPPATFNKLQQLDEIEALYSVMSNEENTEQEKKDQKEEGETKKSRKKTKKDAKEREGEKETKEAEHEGGGSKKKTKKEREEETESKEEERGEEKEEGEKEGEKQQEEKESQVVIAHVDQIQNRQFDVVLYTGVTRTPGLEPQSLLKSVYKSMTSASQLFIYITKQTQSEETYAGNAITFTNYAQPLSTSYKNITLSAAVLTELIDGTKPLTPFNPCQEDIHMLPFNRGLSFLKCPLSFYYQSIAQIPRTHTESSILGKLEHKAAAEKSEYLEYDEIEATRFPMRYFTPGPPKKMKEARLSVASFDPSSVPPSRPIRFPLELSNVQLATVQDDTVLLGQLDKITLSESGEISIIEHKASFNEGKKFALPLQMLWFLYVFEKQFKYPVSTLIGNKTMQEDHINLMFKSPAPFEASKKMEPYMTALNSLVKVGYYPPTPSKPTCSKCDYNHVCPVARANSFNN